MKDDDDEDQKKHSKQGSGMDEDKDVVACYEKPLLRTSCTGTIKSYD